MGKSDGDGSGTPRRKRGAHSEKMQKAGTASGSKANTGATSEADALRQELEAERQRADALEDANIRAAERLEEAMETVKAILDKQGG